MRARAVPLEAWPIGVVFFLASGLTWIERGSIERGDWLPYSFAAAIVLAALLLSGTATRCSRAGAVTIAALVGLACWDASSLAWTPSPSLGHDEALLVLTLAVAFAAVTLAAAGAPARAATAACAVAFSASTALAISVVAISGDSPADLYRAGRLEAPIGYTNGLAALFLLGFWPALAVAAHPTSRWPVRAACVGAAAAMLAGELQAQSKGAAAAVVLAGAVLVAFSPSRLRLLVPAAIVAVCVLPAAGALTEPFRVQEASRAVQTAAIRDSALALLLLTAAATGAGLLYAVVDARVRVSAALVRRVNLAALAAVGLAVASAVVWSAASAGRISDWASNRWDEFGEPSGQQLESGSNFSSLGSSRLDSWEVASRQFAHRPLAGNGARSFQAAYLEHGTTQDTPERSHSLLLDVLSETGLVGFALLLAALGPPLWLLVRRARRSLVDAGLFGAALAWVAHASVDWIWTLPALSLPFVAILAAGASADERRPLPARPSRFAAAAAVVVALGIFVPPWLSARFTESGLAEGRSDSSAFAWSRRLDPLAIEPLLAEADVAASPDEAARILREAVRKEPRSAALHYFLGRELASAGRRREALAELERARRLYPRGPEILAAIRSVREAG